MPCYEFFHYINYINVANSSRKIQFLFGREPIRIPGIEIGFCCHVQNGRSSSWCSRPPHRPSTRVDTEAIIYSSHKLLAFIYFMFHLSLIYYNNHFHTNEHESPITSGNQGRFSQRCPLLAVCHTLLSLNLPHHSV